MALIEPVVITPALIPEVSDPIQFYVGGGYARIDEDEKGFDEQTYPSEGDFGGLGLPHSYNINANNYLLLADHKGQ